MSKICKFLKHWKALIPTVLNEVYEAMRNTGGNYEEMGNIAAGGVYNLVSKNLGHHITAFSDSNGANTYWKVGRDISHNDLLNEIKKKAAGAEGFEIV